MKLVYLLGLLIVSTVSLAVDQQFTENAQEFRKAIESAHAPLSNWSSLPPMNTSPISFAPFGAGHPFTISGGAYSQVSANDQNLALGPQITNFSSGSIGYFTEFQYAIREDLLLTGNWTRLHQSYNYSYDGTRILNPIEWSLITESSASTAKTVELNWTLYEGWHAHAKVQTVNGSAWIPQLNIPRFISQDTEEWALASVEVVYQF